MAPDTAALASLESLPASGSTLWVAEPAAEDAEEPFLLAKVVDAGGGRVVCTKQGQGRVCSVPLSACFACGSDADADDVAKLLHQHEAGLLANLRSRFAREPPLIYTGAGPRVLISLNPNRALANEYGDARMRQYRRGQRGAPPHLFAVAEAAYRGVVRHGTCASIVVSGESGAGKTQASNQLLRYLSWRARSGSDDKGVAGGAGAGAGSSEPPTSLAARVLHSTPVFEAFGNAATTRNHNSSRFGKHMELLLTSQGVVSGARIATYLLERTRVAAAPAAGERNYHVFYYLAAAGLLPGHRDADSFRVLGGAAARSPSMERARGEFAQLRESLKQLFMPEEAQQAVWRLLGALLAATEVSFEADEHGGTRAADSSALQAMEVALGCPGLGALLTTQPMLSPRGGSTYSIALDARKASTARDTLVAELYRCVFEALVARVNAVLSGTRVLTGGSSSDGEGGEGSEGSSSGGAAAADAEAWLACSAAGGAKTTLSVGLLDLFGFESFETNSFEQLCINYANEALQHFFVQCTFHAEELLHHEEGVAWSPVWYPDNREALDLLAKAPTGLFHILDAVCRTPQATDTTFATQLFQVHASHPLLAPPSVQQHATPHHHGTPAPRTPARRPLRRDEGFVLRHFAGDVQYNVGGFLRKSAERLPPEVESMLFDTPSSVARLLLVEHLPLPALGGAEPSSPGERRPHDSSMAQPTTPMPPSPMHHPNAPLATPVPASSLAASATWHAASPTILLAHEQPSPIAKLGLGHAKRGKTVQRLGGGGTVGRQFLAVVRSLMAQLAETSAYFVRCLAPNALAQPRALHGGYVLRQLRCSGTSALLRMGHAAHPTRIPYNELYSRFRASAPAELGALPPSDFAEGLVLALGIPMSQFELGHTMLFFKAGAAARLHELESLTRAELTAALREAVGDFATRAAAKRTIERGLSHWLFWRRLRAARGRRRAEHAARTALTHGVQSMRWRAEARAAVAVRRQQRTEERAAALRSVHGAIARLKQVWQHAPALEVALKAAESAAQHRALAPDFVASAECEGKLAAAVEQLHRLSAWEEHERLQLTRSQATPVAASTPVAGTLVARTPVAGGALSACDCHESASTPPPPSPRLGRSGPSRVQQLVRAAETRAGDSPVKPPLPPLMHERALTPGQPPPPASAHHGAHRGAVSCAHHGAHHGEAEANHAHQDDPILRTLKLPARAAQPEFAARLRAAKPPPSRIGSDRIGSDRSASPLSDTAEWRAMLCGARCAHGGAWPAARRARVFTLCVAPLSDGDCDLERRLLARDVVPYLGALCRRLHIELMLVELTLPVDPRVSPPRQPHAAAPWQSPPPPPSAHHPSALGSQAAAAASAAASSAPGQSPPAWVHELLVECAGRSLGTWYVVPTIPPGPS